MCDPGPAGIANFDSGTSDTGTHTRHSFASAAMRRLFRSLPVAFRISASSVQLVGELSSAARLHMASP